MIFGSQRDAKLLLRVRRELLGNIVEQEILFYKIDLNGTVDNIYGESEEKFYFQPVRLVCLIDRGDQQWGVEDYGPDLTRATTFKFIKDDFQDLNTKPEPGDVIQWHGNYFEIDATNENQMWVGKDEEYRLNPQELGRFGESVSIVCTCHQARYTKLSIKEPNL